MITEAYNHDWWWLPHIRIIVVSSDKKHIEISPNDRSSRKFPGGEGGHILFPEVSIPEPTKHGTDDTKLYLIYIYIYYIYVKTTIEKDESI